MKMVVVAVRDRELNAYGVPMFMQTVGQAVRLFADEINRKAENNAYNAHPGDFDMYLLGEFDTETGRFSQEEPARMVAVGKDLIQK